MPDPSRPPANDDPIRTGVLESDEPAEAFVPPGPSAVEIAIDPDLV